MTATGGDARAKRAQARSERRARSSTQQTSERRGDEPQASESSNGPAGNGSTSALSTPKLMAAGAAAGALLGTAKAVRERRHAHDDQDERDELDEGEERGTGGRDGGEHETGQPAGVRGLVVSVLEAALDALHEPGRGRQERAHESEEREREEDDDEEAEREPRDEQSDDGRPSARGESAEAGRDEAEGGADAGADEGATGSVAPEDQGAQRGVTESHRNGRGGADATEIVERAREQLAGFVGKEPESASRVERVDGGWELAFEVVELPRVPSSTDVMASYSVSVDDSGSVKEYGRTHRYYRNRAEGSA